MTRYSKEPTKRKLEKRNMEKNIRYCYKAGLDTVKLLPKN